MKSVDKINIAIIGCGRIFRKHRDAIIGLGFQNNVTLLYEPNGTKLKEASSYFPNAKCMQEYAPTGFFEDNINLAVILTPHNNHFYLSKYFLEKGISVVCEKPIAQTPLEVAKLFNTASENNCRFYPVLQNRYNSAVQCAKELIKNGWIGQVLHMEARCLWARPQEYYDQAEWRGKDWDSVLYNQAIHHIDLLPYLTDAHYMGVKTAEQKTLCHKIDTSDFATMSGVLDLGEDKLAPTFKVTATTCCYQKNIEASVLILGTTGHIHLHGDACNKITFRCRSLPEKEMEEIMSNRSEEIEDVYGKGHRLMYEEIFKTWDNGKETELDKVPLEVYDAIHMAGKLCNSENKS